MQNPKTQNTFIPLIKNQILKTLVFLLALSPKPFPVNKQTKPQKTQNQTETKNYEHQSFVTKITQIPHLINFEDRDVVQVPTELLAM